MTIRAAFQIGDWVIFPERNMIASDGTSVSLEPKVMALLIVLSDAKGAVISRADIEEEIWGQIIVGEDTVARQISKLRKAFGDTAQDSKYIETISKKGYRLMQPPRALETVEIQNSQRRGFAPILISLAVIALVITLFVAWPDNTKSEKEFSELARADDLYMNFNYADNETAIKLYEQVLAVDSDNTRAQSGLSNALVQRVIRWPDGKSKSETGTDSLRNALSLNLHQTEFGQTTLKRATALSERAARLSPKNADALKALGLTYAAQGRLEDAKTTYEKAIELDSMAWESMVNLGEIYLMEENAAKSLEYFTTAYNTMDESYATEPQKVGQWQSQMGTLIARLHLQQTDLGEAEIWYRRVLRISPLDKEASIGLAAILRVNGDKVQADMICRELQERLEDVTEC